MTHLVRSLLMDTRAVCGHELHDEDSITSDLSLCSCPACLQQTPSDVIRVQITAGEQRLLTSIIKDFRDGISCVDPHHDAKRKAVNTILKKILGSTHE